MSNNRDAYGRNDVRGDHGYWRCCHYYKRRFVADRLESVEHRVLGDRGHNRRVRGGNALLGTAKDPGWAVVRQTALPSLTAERRLMMRNLLTLLVPLALITACGPAAAVKTAPLPAVPMSTTRPASIPVIVYHELDNGCAATVPACNAADPGSLSKTQFARELAYLKRQGYHSVTAAQYVAWVEHETIPLPLKPVLLTDDNGIGDFLEGAQPILRRYGFTVVAFIVTGFADAASGRCDDVRLQPGCPRINVGWDLTWDQIRALPAQTSFALEAGASGHYVQDYSPSCQMFYACVEPGESDAAYERRVGSEMSRGTAELNTQLPRRVNDSVWVVPYSDLGYPRCAQPSCTPQPSTGPSGWLVQYAASRYPVVFVEDAVRNGVQHERFRFEPPGSMSETSFEQTLNADIAAGDFGH